MKTRAIFSLLAIVSILFWGSQAFAQKIGVYPGTEPGIGNEFGSSDMDAGSSGIGGGTPGIFGGERGNPPGGIGSSNPIGPGAGGIGGSNFGTANGPGF